jgi:hypothetical protein
MKLDTIKTTMKALAKLNKLEVKLDKDGKDFTDTNNLNSAAKCVHFALSTNGLYNFYRPDTWFMDFLQHLCERRDFMGDYYGIGEAVATYGKDVIMYAAGACRDAYHEAYTCTHDLDDLHLRGDDIEKICIRFLNEVKEYAGSEFTNWKSFISGMDTRSVQNF